MGMKRPRLDISNTNILLGRTRRSGIGVDRLHQRSARCEHVWLDRHGPQGRVGARLPPQIGASLNQMKCGHFGLVGLSSLHRQ